MMVMPENTPIIGKAQVKLLERLCNAVAVSGDEAEVRAIVLEEIRPHSENIKIDVLGNVLAIRHGQGRHRLRVMLAAHMDEVGFMLTANDGKGLFRFETIGSMDVRQLVGKRVWVSREHVPGVIGARPIHLTTSEDSVREFPLEALRIDIGTENEKVKLGERAAFATRFTRLGPSLRAKALDDRLGVATLVELVRLAPTNIDLMAAFTTQEEIGHRGAKVAAYALEPDLAIVIDSTPAFDLPSHDGSENTSYNTRLGKGPALYIADGGTLSDPRLVRFLMETAGMNKIPFQLRQPGGGGTDAAAIQQARTGIPSISVSVPGRYAHTAMGLCRLEDWKNTLRLLHAALWRITPALLGKERR